MAFDIEMIKKVYANMTTRVDKAREIVGRPLTLTEKILYNHLWEGMSSHAFTRGKDYVDFAPDRVACQDATAQMALLQFMHACKSKVAVPTTVHCDHLIQAKVDAKTDIFESVGCKDSVYNVSNAVFNYTTTTLNYTTSVITVTATNITIPVANASYASASICTALTTGLQAFSNTEFISVYPNPGNSVLNINSDEVISSMIIRDVTGKEILSGKINKQINVSSLEAGVYFISFYDENEQLFCIKKFVKQ